MKEKVLFGCGAVAEKNLHLNPKFIVDNNPDLQGGVFRNLDVLSPEALRGMSPNYDVIVCSTSIDAIRPQLENLGYAWGENARMASQLNEILAIDDLERTRFRFLITSGLPSHLLQSSGGGVYLVEEQESEVLVSKLFQGNVHGLIKSSDGGFYFNAQGEGVYRLDLEDTRGVEKVFDMPKGLRAHGMFKSDRGWYIVSSYEDALIELNKDGIEISRFSFSSKKDYYESAQHHCNDVVVNGNYAYVSMFSVSGNWKRGIFDGGVIEIDLKSGLQRVIVSNLTMPHNISFYQNEIRVLNSFKGEILVGDFEPFGSLPGFVRGYDEDEKYVYVGESKNRNFSRLQTARSPVSIDTRITVINKELRFARSLCLPRTISEIHSVIRVE